MRSYCLLGQLLLLGLLTASLASAEVSVSYWADGAEEMRLTLHNTANQFATHHVYAGEVHPCFIPGHQPLVAAQDLIYTLSPNETKVVNIPVYCGNAHIPCAPGLPYLPPTRVHPVLRRIILQNLGGGDSWQTQILIWQETDQRRLPESGPPTILEILTPHAPPTGPSDAPGLMCRASALPMEALPCSATDQVHRQVRASAAIAGFLLIPVPVTILLVITWFALPRRRFGPQHLK